MEKELDFLMELYEKQKAIMTEHSTGGIENKPREGHEVAWNEAKEKADLLLRGMKLIHAGEHALKAVDRYKVAEVVEMLLNESATAHLCGLCGTADSLEVKVFDGIRRKIIATFKVRITSMGTLIFDGYQFF